MSPRLVTAILARDEASRDLSVVIRVCQTFSDAVLLLDDGSTDDTVKIATELGCLVKRRVTPGAAWGAESVARQDLWERGAKLARDGWLLILDADMLLMGDPRCLADSWDVNAWGFILFDAWSETEFRYDGPWAGGPSLPRPWMFKPSACPNPQWNQRGIHPGHAPVNFPLVMGIAPPDTHYFIHRAYVSPERRKVKHAQYLSQKNQLSPTELAHAESIVD